jgi:hypothetical protein
MSRRVAAKQWRLVQQAGHIGRAREADDGNNGGDEFMRLTASLSQQAVSPAGGDSAGETFGWSRAAQALSSALASLAPRR